MHSRTFRLRRYVLIATKPVHVTPTANAPNSALLPFPKLHPGPCSSVGMWRGTNRQGSQQRHFLQAST